MNLELFEKIKEQITQFPATFDMRDWVWFPDYASPARPCGTVACIGGWALLLSGKPVYHPGTYITEREIKVTLGITNVDILYHTRWPLPFLRRYKSLCPMGGLAAALACEVIDDYIATNEWGRGAAS